MLIAVGSWYVILQEAGLSLLAHALMASYLHHLVLTMIYRYILSFVRRH